VKVLIKGIGVLPPRNLLVILILGQLISRRKMSEEKKPV
jgi:hypothetical protein